MDEKRAEYYPHVGDGNVWIEARQRQPMAQEVEDVVSRPEVLQKLPFSPMGKEIVLHEARPMASGTRKTPYTHRRWHRGKKAFTMRIQADE